MRFSAVDRAANIIRRLRDFGRKADFTKELYERIAEQDLEQRQAEVAVEFYLKADNYTVAAPVHMQHQGQKSCSCRR